MKIRIVCVGKSKENDYKHMEKEYLKRLSRFAAVEIVEVADERSKDNPSEADIRTILKKEAQRVQAAIKNYKQVYVLAEEGAQERSVAFAARIESIMQSGQDIAFIIGGSHGLSDTVKKDAVHLLSFSEMTFPHRLARILLLEQLFRAFKINHNEVYHK